MADLNEVKAVGFSFLSPEVVLLVADKTAHCLHFFPSKAEGSRSLDLSDATRPHWVLLKAPEHIGAMAQYADRITRLLVFGRAEELLGLGLPILDATVSGTNVEVNRRSSRDELLARIDEEAVALSLNETNAVYETLKKQERDKMENKPSGRTFFQQLKELKSIVGKDNPSLQFVTQIGIPAVKRIMGDIDRDTFVLVCKALVTDGGVDDPRARAFYRWVEGFDGEGVELGKAVDALLYPKQDATERMRGEEEWTDTLTESVASQFGVSETDLLFVARSYIQLQEDAAPVVPPPVEEPFDGFPTDEPPDTEYTASEDEEEEKEEPEAKYPGEDGFEDDTFGWPSDDEEAGSGDVDESNGFHETDLSEESDDASVFDDNPDFSDFQ